MRRLWSIYVCLGFLLMLLASCQAKSPGSEAEHAQSVSITKWTTQTELFVEFTPFTVGTETPLAVHLTDLGGFHPVSTDILTTALESAERQGVTVRTEVPTVPGIYRPIVKLEQPGAYRLVFRRFHRETQALLDTIEVGDVVVTRAEESSAPIAEGAEERGVTFLKEQQWRIAFATEEVTPRELLATLTLHAEVKPAAGGEVHISAPVGGRVLAPGKGAPILGHMVEPGEPLALVVPLHPTGTNRTELESGIKTAQAELAAAEHEFTRVQDLYQDRIVPKRRVEQAQKDVAVLQARLASTRLQLALLDTSQAFDGNALSPALERFTLRAPMAGTVAAVRMTPGALIEAGHDLLTLVDLERVWIEGRVFEPDIPKVHTAEQARFTTQALSEPMALAAPHARLVTVGSVIDPTTRSVPLVIEVKNAGARLKIGMRGELTVPTGEQVRDLAIPLSALVDEKGIPIAFVQVAGETFARRELTLGIQSDGYVQVKAGLTAGERVVTTGAYRVYLASLVTELPAHGHAH